MVDTKRADKFGWTEEDIRIRPPRRDGVVSFEHRSTSSRLRLREAFRPVLVEALNRVVKREVAAIREKLAEGEVRAADAEFLNWLQEYEQEEVRPFLEQALAPTLAAYAGAVESEVLSELGRPAVSETQAPFLAAYGAILSNIYAERSVGQLRALGKPKDGISPEEAIAQRLGEWLLTRADKVARIESVRAGEAAAHDTYKRGGVTRLQWRTNGKNCQYCSRLNGKTVGVQETFIPAGTDLQGGENDAPMKIRGAKLHPPAHRSCACLLRPAE